MKLLNNGKMYDKILVLPDLHCPFMNWKAVKVAAKWARKHEPELVIQLGDIMDQKAWSRFPKDSDDPSPHQEFELAIEAMDRLADMFPDMHILMGNHDLRIAKAALEVGFTRHVLRELDEIFEYPGWVWHTNPRDYLIVNTRRGPVLFRHGDEEGGTPQAKSRLFGMSVVQGHDHQARIEYTSTLKGSVFGMSCGHLMDTTSKAATYAMRNGKYPVTGIGIIKFGVPYFIPVTGEEKRI